jgi:Mn2+/Fe2+ NRAMP family transporter
VSGPVRENEITGAFGTIRAHDGETRRGLRARLLTLLAIIGPGLIVMVGDNDAGGVSTYAQAGQNYAYTLLWTLPLIVPVLIANQEMVARLGAVTGVGHGRLIRERIGRRWGNVSVASILVLNFLIIVTEFIGVSMSMQFFGVSRFLAVPVAAVVLFALTATGTFRSWERFMMLFVAVNLLIVPLVVLAHPRFGPFVHGLVVPSVRGGATSAAVLLIVSIVGTTVAPWQLYFQQSNIVDKRISPRWLNYERIDTILGSVIVIIGASLLIAITAAGLATHGGTDAFTSAFHVAEGLSQHVSYSAGAIFAILLLNASIIGAAAVTLASSYALGDVSGLRQGLDLRVTEARAFYGAFAGLLLVAAGITLASPNHLLGIITLMVQAMCGMMLPSTTIFVLILANDEAILGPWVNSRAMNILSTIVVAALSVLSVVMMISTVIPSAPVLGLLVAFGAVAAVAVVVGLPIALRRAPEREPFEGDRRDWRTPRLRLLAPPIRSRSRRWLLRVIGAYLVVAGVAIVVRFIQLAVS